MRPFKLLAIVEFYPTGNLGDPCQNEIPRLKDFDKIFYEFFGLSVLIIW
jgi:hypothetical protein